MTRKQIFVAFVFFLGFLGQSLWAITADEVLQGVENRYIGKTSKSAMTMTLIDAKGRERNRKLINYRRKQDNDNKGTFIHFLEPSDMRNTTYLVNEIKREQSKWIYLSAFKNVRKIVASDYALAFVSSDFTYEDMDDIHADDFNCSQLKEEVIDGETCYSIDCKKKKDNTSYSHSVMKVSKDKKIVVKAFLYDKSDPEKIIKEMTAKDLKKVQDIWTPHELEMKDLVKGTSTALKLHKVAYDLELDASTFTQRNMQK